MRLEQAKDRSIRAVLKPNLYGGQEDQQEQDAGISGDHLSRSSSCREFWSNNVDYRISGIHLSVVEMQDINRKDKVKTLIQQFENLPNRESLLQDLKQTEKINTFSEKSQKLIVDMNNTEIFELCETSSKRQCPNCNLYWEVGIVYCTCGRCLKSSQKKSKSTTRTTTTSYQFLTMLSERITVVVPNRDRQKDNECIPRLRRYCKKSSSIQAWRTQIYT